MVVPTLRRIRAAIGIGLTWAAAWFGAGILLARVPGFYSDLPFALLFAPLGFVTGVIFSGILVVAFLESPGDVPVSSKPTGPLHRCH